MTTLTVIVTATVQDEAPFQELFDAIHDAILDNVPGELLDDEDNEAEVTWTVSKTR
jgi:hypothetical protein